jgi:hypothetical protein
LWSPRRRARQIVVTRRRSALPPVHLPVRVAIHRPAEVDSRHTGRAVSFQYPPHRPPRRGLFPRPPPLAGELPGRSIHRATYRAITGTTARPRTTASARPSESGRGKSRLTGEAGGPPAHVSKKNTRRASVSYRPCAIGWDRAIQRRRSMPRGSNGGASQRHQGHASRQRDVRNARAKRSVSAGPVPVKTRPHRTWSRCCHASDRPAATVSAAEAARSRSSPGAVLAIQLIAYLR